MSPDKFDIINTEFGEAVYVGSNVELSMEFAIKNKIKGIIVSHDKGYVNQNVDFLKKYPFIEKLVIQHYGRIDLTGIHSLNKLKN